MTKLLFVSPHPFYPDSSGGSQLSSLYLFKSLRQMGWQVEVICTRSLSRLRKLQSPYYWHSYWQSLMRFRRMPCTVVMDEELGYPCWRVIPSRFTNERSELEFLAQRLREYQPDVVIGHCSIKCPLLNYAASQGYQTIYFVRHVEDLNYKDSIVIPDGLKLIANSPFAASIIAEVSGHVPEVILPFLEVERYRVSNRQHKYITFINPVPEKGVNVAIEVARQLPEEKFLFVKGKWPGYIDIQHSLLEPIYKLPNVEIWEHQQDMRVVYEATDILLVPSQFDETFGRVIVEAQVNSIPIVAAKVGGIPYTVGKGGILVEPIDKSQAYVDALRLLRTDEKFYAELSELAFKNSQRQEFDAQFQVKKFVHFVESHISYSYP